MPSRSEHNRRAIAHLKRLVQRFGRCCSVGAWVLGSVVIGGWLLDIDSLKSVGPGLPTMKVNTAVCLLFGGLSLTLMQATTETRWQPWRRRFHLFSRLTAGIIFFLGATTLLQYLLGWNLGIDQWLWAQPEPAGSTAAPGRMSPNTALTFTLLGGALLIVFNTTLNLIAQGLTLLAGAIAFMALLGYLFGAVIFYQLGTASGMAVHTALGCLALGFGCCPCCRTRGG